MKTSKTTGLKPLSEMNFFEMREEAIERKIKHNGVKKEVLLKQLQEARLHAGVKTEKVEAPKPEPKKYIAVPKEVAGLMGAKAIEKRPKLSDKSDRKSEKSIVGKPKQTLDQKISVATEAHSSILNLDCKKHIKIFKLSQLSLSNKHIAELCETNAGHVWNVLNSYNSDPEKIAAANSI